MKPLISMNQLFLVFSFGLKKKNKKNYKRWYIYYSGLFPWRFPFFYIWDVELDDGSNVKIINDGGGGCSGNMQILPRQECAESEW